MLRVGTTEALSGRDRNAARITVGRKLQTRTLSVVRRVPSSALFFDRIDPSEIRSRCDFVSFTGRGRIFMIFFQLPDEAEKEPSAGGGK